MYLFESDRNTVLRKRQIEDAFIECLAVPSTSINFLLGDEMKDLMAALCPGYKVNYRLEYGK